MGMAGRSGMRSLRSRLSGGGAMRARCCSMRASLWMSSIFLGPSTFLRACQPCFSLRSMTSCRTNRVSTACKSARPKLRAT